MSNDYKRASFILGDSDIAAITATMPDGPAFIKFGSDGHYDAWWVTDEAVEIPDHYSLDFTTHHWIKFFDDFAYRGTIYADTIEVYRAGSFGCIVRTIGNVSFNGIDYMKWPR